jgi:hypothetical protein
MRGAARFKNRLFFKKSAFLAIDSKLKLADLAAGGIAMDHTFAGQLMEQGLQGACGLSSGLGIAGLYGFTGIFDSSPHLRAAAAVTKATAFGLLVLFDCIFVVGHESLQNDKRAARLIPKLCLVKKAACERLTGQECA